MNRFSGRVTIEGTGGLALILGALSFMAVFAYLAAAFSYPDILDGAAADVLPRLLATGAEGRAAWSIYAFLPLLWIPAGAGAFHRLRGVHEGTMRVAMLLALVSSLSMMLGLLRWPSIHWQLAEAYAAGSAADRYVIGTVFDGLNSFLGNFIGEFLGELSLNLFFLLTAATMLSPRSGYRRIWGVAGVCAAMIGLIGMLRNVTDVVDLIADVNNYILPVWMIALGIALVRNGPVPEGAAPPGA